MSIPMMRMPPPFELGSSKRELAGNTTPTDPRSQRIRASRKGRPCNELGLSAQGLLAACPHLRAPGAPRPGWAHHKAAPSKEQPDAKGTAGIMPDNGQAERMNRTIKDATVKAFHYEDLESLKAHVLAFVAAYNFAKHLKALRWRTPFQAIQDIWTKDPTAFKINPHRLIPRPNN
jgi:hypothetical protein